MSRRRTQSHKANLLRREVPGIRPSLGVGRSESCYNVWVELTPDDTLVSERSQRHREMLRRWGSDQRAMARAVGLTIEEWLVALDEASLRRAGVTAAIIGAAARRGVGPRVLDGFDPEKLVAAARAVIDPKPPRVSNALLKEAVRRADELGEGSGARRLRRPTEHPRTEDIPRPRRGDSRIGPSACVATADAPGEE